MAKPEPKERYDYICTQIDREDNLNQRRFATCVALNLALATAAATQLSSDSALEIRLTIFILCCVVSIFMTALLQEAMSAGSAQLKYLRDQFNEDPELRLFPRPFFEGKLPTDRFIHGRSPKFTYFLIGLWFLSIPIGSLFIVIGRS
jgi:hypothetical protein